MSKLQSQHIGFGILRAPVVTILVWDVRVVQAFHLHNAVLHNLLRAASLAFTAPNLRKIGVGSGLFGIAVTWIIVSCRFGYPPHQQTRFCTWQRVHRARRAGALYAPGPGPEERGRRYPDHAGRVPIPAAVERLHF